MQISNRLFSYPVYSLDADDYKDNHFTFDYDVESDGNTIYIKYKTKIGNKHIQRMLENKVIELAVLMECPRTAFRQLFILENREGCLEIPSSSVTFKAELCCLLISKTDFDLSKENGISNDYGDVKFRIQKGFIVGYDNTYPFSIDKDKEDEFKTSSIISVVKKLDLNDCADIDLDNPDKIKIQLNPEMYNMFVQLQGQDKLPIVHSMIVLPALVYVIDQIRHEELRKMYEDYYWYRCICKQLEIMKLEIDGKEFNKKSSLAIAQEILKRPIIRALEELTNIKGEE